MTVQTGHGRNEIINKLHAYLKNRVSKDQAKLIELFAHRYYAPASLEDLHAHTLDDLFGALLAHWELISTRKPKEAKVRVFNPSLEVDGWQSKHTIILISHDDIPFLVDSIRMEVNRK